MPSETIVVAARDEAERIGATLAALAVAFPSAQVWVADDASRDRTAQIAEGLGARVARSERHLGKGGAVTAALREAVGERSLAAGLTDAVVVLCDADLGDSARELAPLAAAVRDGEAELAIAAFAQRVGGGFGVALGFGRWAIRRRCGLDTRAPLSGQRALSAAALAELLPFAPGFGIEVGMTIDAVRAGRRVREIELELSHRVSGRSLAGFLHRGRQLLDLVRAYLARRRAPGASRARNFGPARR